MTPTSTESDGTTLRAENDRLRAENQGLQEEVALLHKQYQAYAERMRAIQTLAGMELPDR